MIRRGAPFDKGNIFNIPPLDGGEIVSLYDTVISRIEGGTFILSTHNYFDGGSIPILGTANYNPNIIYGPDSPLLGDDE